MLQAPNLNPEALKALNSENSKPRTCRPQLSLISRQSGCESDDDCDSIFGEPPVRALDLRLRYHMLRSDVVTLSLQEHQV